jgi:hypothetical protein
MGGRDQSERPVAINRNQWSQSAGTPIKARRPSLQKPFPLAIVTVQPLEGCHEKMWNLRTIRLLGAQGA